MSDYIPTTEEVRNAALTDYCVKKITPQQFDRWLANIRAKAFADGAIAGYNDAIQNTYTTNPYLTNE